jgi:hypothetical protein
MNHRRITFIAGALIFVVGVLVSVTLQNLMRPYARDGMYFQAWSSEDMMQTVSIRDLREAPVQTLLNIHIQPPGFDLIRGILVQFWPSLNLTDLLKRVDYSLYFVWALILGALGLVVFLWLAEQCGLLIAIAGSLIFLLHPASIFFATYLDTTLLSAFLILWAYYLLWRIKNGRPVSIWLLSLINLTLFLTRSIFQLPTFILLAACLYLLGVPRRALVTFIVVTGLISGLYIAKQWHQFRILSTSSLGGVNLANSVGVGMGTANYSRYLDDPRNLTITDERLPDVLISRTKLNGQPNFNNINYLVLNDSLFGRFQKKLLSAPVGELVASYAENLAIYFKPSSTYSSDHVIVDRLPWTNLYNGIFSAPFLPILLVISLAVWLARLIRGRRYAQGLGLMLPGLYVFLASVLLDKGENMRFKFFLEPVMFILVVSQLYFVLHIATARLLKRRPAG